VLDLAMEIRDILRVVVFGDSKVVPWVQRVLNDVR
jgi:hypothetical protein